MRIKLILFAFAFLLFACKSEKQSAPEETNYQNLNVEQFMAEYAKAENAVMIDVRTPGEIADGKIGDALEIDYNADGFDTKILAFDKSQPMYIYCQSGGRSSKTCEQLIENGFVKVYNLEGGYSAYSEQNQ